MGGTFPERSCPRRLMVSRLRALQQNFQSTISSIIQGALHYRGRALFHDVKNVSSAQPGRNLPPFFRRASENTAGRRHACDASGDVLISMEKLAHPARFELTTSAFGGQRSIQLSYGCPRSLHDQRGWI
jgi:hypothetical protein